MPKIKAPLGTGKRQSRKAVALGQGIDSMAPAPTPLSASATKENDDWKVKGAYDDIMRAEGHKQDPDLMMKVHKHAKRQLKTIKSIADINDYKNAAYGAGGFKDEDTDGV